VGGAGDNGAALSVDCAAITAHVRFLIDNGAPTSMAD
jgi:hypothetical protein